MRKYSDHILLLIIGLFLVFPSSLYGSGDHKKPKEQATVIKIIDGDSLEVSHNGRSNSIRLYGIDSPEWQQPYSRKARFYLEKLLLGNDVLLEELYIDKFGRSVALVYYQGNSVNQLLVEKGLAWVHIYYCHKKICEHWKILEQVARTKKLGLWKEKKPVPPWVWKKSKK